MNPSCKREDCTIIGAHSHDGLFERIAKFQDASFIHTGSCVSLLGLGYQCDCHKPGVEIKELLSDCQTEILRLEKLNNTILADGLHSQVDLKNMVVDLRAQLVRAEALLHAVEHHFETPYEKRVTSPGGIAGAVASYFKEKP